MTQPDERGYYPPEEARNVPPRPAPPPPLPQPVVPLEYRYTADPTEQRRTRMKTLGRVALGCVGYFILCALWFVFGSALVRGGTIVGRDRYDLLWLGWLAMTLTLLGLTLYLRLRFRIKGYGYGILAALGLVFIGIPLLILGLCFYAM